VTQRIIDIRNVNDAWLHMWRGMRAYGVAITVIWTMAAFAVLAAFAVAADRWWLHVAFAVGALLEIAVSALTLRYLVRASNAGRFDT
jgi:membrane protein YdbS with pleckstrin-like domain